MTQNNHLKVNRGHLWCKIYRNDSLKTVVLANNVKFTTPFLAHPFRADKSAKKQQNLLISDTFALILGSFGRVMLAKNKKTGEFFAMKRLKKADIIKLRQVDHVISENTILADIDHPYLVSTDFRICCFYGCKTIQMQTN